MGCGVVLKFHGVLAMGRQSVRGRCEKTTGRVRIADAAFRRNKQFLDGMEAVPSLVKDVVLGKAHDLVGFLPVKDEQGLAGGEHPTLLKDWERKGPTAVDPISGGTRSFFGKYASAWLL